MDSDGGSKWGVIAAGAHSHLRRVVFPFRAARTRPTELERLIRDLENGRHAGQITGRPLSGNHASFRFSGPVAQNQNRGRLASIGAAGLTISVLTHVCEGLQLFPSMGWGLTGSVGHYLDLSSAVLGVTLFPVGYLWQALYKP
jgi:hypothetical protein